MDRARREAPRSAYYDGWPYALAMEPLSRLLFERVVRRIPEGARVLDVACGTGALARALAGRCREVVGVDLSPRQIARAERDRRRRGLSQVRFRVADAARLDHEADRSYERACLVMALHEIPAWRRATVLRELCRVAERALVVDFAVPLPRSPSGLGLRLLELLAGPRHFSGFLSWCREGGLPASAAEAGLHVARTDTWGRGNLAVLELTA